jgi:multicomponent Na+:H+ antiporter subunit B
MGLIMLYAGSGIAEFGDPKSPAAQHVSDHYIEHAYHDAHTPNIVTVMIADYRSFDTLGETVVVFAAGMACFLLLRGNRRKEEEA